MALRLIRVQTRARQSLIKQKAVIMDTLQRMKIQNLREQILQEVRVEDIIDHLISNEVVTEDEWEQIKAEKTRKDRIHHLLDLLLQKSIDTFDHFVSALDRPYDWLSKELKANGGPQAYQVEEKMYVDTHLLGRIPWSPPYNIERKEKKTRKDRIRHLLNLLLQKTIDTFDHFVSALDRSYDWLSKVLKGDGGPQAYQVEEKMYVDTLLLGGIPRSPPYNIERKEKKEEVRSCLHSLSRGKYVVLHGMPGCGKSCLAVAALENKQLLIEKFNRAVYWLSVGDVSTVDLLCHMTDLMEKLSHHPAIEAEKKVQSSTSVSSARESLRRYFTSKALYDGLLILDDVSSSDVIDAFDIGCKILVTTKDAAVMKKVEGRYNLITISEGFTEQESLSLLANCVGVGLLPPQAKKIHKLSKGTPMVIALIGGQLAKYKEDAKRNPGRWDYHLDVLTKRNYGVIRSSYSQQDGLFHAIGICVNNLPENMKSLYQDLALFVEDVNIKPEVLGTLWNRNKYEVEHIMSEFLKKSLAVSKWNEVLNSYVYGIHYLFLSYLKKQLTDQEKKKLHKKLLASYAAVCDGKFANLINDNYFFFYVGHHLSEAKMWHMFPKLYLDIEFIGAKLKYTGPGDVLLDYKKYNTYITNGDEHFGAILRDFEQFVRKHGLDLHKYHDMDIIQCGLQESRKSHVFKEALKTAKARRRNYIVNFFEFF